MVDPKDIFQEIKSVTSDLISVGMCIDQTFPAMRPLPDGGIDVCFQNIDDLSIPLRNMPYNEIYSSLAQSKSYNMRFLDGGLVQLQYRFFQGELRKHRLCFFPSPDLLEYQNNAEIYDQDEMYADVTAKNIVTVPMRFDFDRAAFIQGRHPMSHLTVGQYKNCRIPVSAPVTPFHFIRFVLKSFYNTPFTNLCESLQSTAPRFERTIVDEELTEIHVQVCEPG
jgi:hypothetical protein